MSELPWMGLGISSNLDSRDVPHPYRLREEGPSLFDYVEYSAPLSLASARRDASLFSELWNQRPKVPVLFHPVHLNLYGPTLESADDLRDLAEVLGIASGQRRRAEIGQTDRSAGAVRKALKLGLITPTD